MYIQHSFSCILFISELRHRVRGMKSMEHDADFTLIVGNACVTTTMYLMMMLSFKKLKTHLSNMLC